MRHFSEKIYHSLKKVCEVAYDHAGGNTLFQHSTRVVVSQLSKYASLKEEDERTYMPIDVAIDLDRAADTPIVTARMAEILGYRLMPLETRVLALEPLSEQDALTIMDDATALWQLTRRAFADGKIDAFERKQLLQKLYEMMRAGRRIIDKLEEGMS